MIERVVLLADESARYRIGGLFQLDRLLRILEECFVAASADGSGPEVLVFWQAAPLLSASSPRLCITELAGGSLPAPARNGNTLVLGTDVVLSRGALAGMLRVSDEDAPFTILGPEAFPAAWERLAARRTVRRFGESAWIIRDPAAVSRVERHLFKSLGKPTDGVVSRLLNRPISRRVSRALVRLGATPNQVSMAVLLLILASLWVLTQGNYRGFVVGMLMFQLASILDGCDGEIARVRFQESRLGAWLDTGVDFAGNLLLPVAIGIGLSRQLGLAPDLRSAYLLEGVLTAVGICLALVGLTRFARPDHAGNFKELGSAAVERWGLSAGLRSLLQGVVHLLRRDSFAFWFAVWAVLGHPAWILHAMAIGIALHFPVIGWWWWQMARTSAPLRAPDQP